MKQKYQVRWNKGKAHLSEDGRKTFCGQKIWGFEWATDQDATLEEYVKLVRPRCSSCRMNAEVGIVVNQEEQE